MSKSRAVIDANVLYGSFARDLLLSLFAAGIYEAKWTDQITKEWVGHLLKNDPSVTQAKIDRTVALMNQIQPAALVQRYEQFIGQIDIPDKDDRHVVATAIACGAQKILTWDLGDFPNQVLAAFGVHAESPDKFIANLIIDNPTVVVRIFRDVRQRFKAPPMSVAQFFESLKRNRLELTSLQLSRYHDLL